MLMKLEFSYFMKIYPVGAEILRTDRQTDTTKLTIAFRNFANMPKNRIVLYKQGVFL